MNLWPFTYWRRVLARRRADAEVRRKLNADIAALYASLT